MFAFSTSRGEQLGSVSRHLMKQIDDRYLINSKAYRMKLQNGSRANPEAQEIAKEFTFQRNLKPIEVRVGEARNEQKVL